MVNDTCTFLVQCFSLVVFYIQLNSLLNYTNFVFLQEVGEEDKDKEEDDGKWVGRIGGQHPVNHFYDIHFFSDPSFPG